MGDPKFPRKLYETPNHPWQSARIKEEKDLVKKYGLKNKTEIWKARSRLRQIRGQARDLQGKQRLETPQIKRETEGLLGRLRRMGLIDENAHLSDILALNVEAVLMRRLQTMAYLKGLAQTPVQARQLIVHGHVSIGGRRVTIPGYTVSQAEEAAIEYAMSSPLQNPDHPVRPKVIEAQELIEIAPPEVGRQRGGGRGRGPNAQGGGPGGGRPGGGFGRGGPGGGRGGFRGGPGGGRPGPTGYKGRSGGGAAGGSSGGGSSGGSRGGASSGGATSGGSSESSSSGGSEGGSSGGSESSNEGGSS